jgi:hypothetical protein
MSCIFVHGGAGYHSLSNEESHIAVCKRYVWRIASMSPHSIDDTKSF